MKVFIGILLVLLTTRFSIFVVADAWHKVKGKSNYYNVRHW